MATDKPHQRIPHQLTRPKNYRPNGRLSRVTSGRLTVTLSSVAIVESRKRGSDYLTRRGLIRSTGYLPARPMPSREKPNMGECLRPSMSNGGGWYKRM